jgi:hypothetical protein
MRRRCSPENLKATVNINSEFGIDSCPESGEEPAHPFGIWNFGFAHLLNPKLEYQNPKFLC